MENIKMPELTSSATENINSLLGDFSFNEIIKEIVNGRFSADSENLMRRAFNIFMGELSESFILIGALAGLVILCAFLKNLQSSFERKETAHAADYAVFVYLAVINAAAFEKSCEVCAATARDITVLVQGIVPVMALVYACGGGVWASFSHPIIFMICSVFSAVIQNVITPLIALRAMTSLIAGISHNSGMDEFSEIFAKIHKTLLALSMSVFAGILTMSRFAAVSFDNLASRGVRFAASAVPVVGSSISEAVNTVYGSALLLKSAVGITGVIMLFAVFFVPMIKLGALYMVFRLTAAVAAPVTNKCVTETIKKTGECVNMFFSTIACMGIIMIIAIASLM